MGLVRDTVTPASPASRQMSRGARGNQQTHPPSYLVLKEKRKKRDKRRKTDIPGSQRQKEEEKRKREKRDKLMSRVARGNQQTHPPSYLVLKEKRKKTEKEKKT